MTCDAMHTEHFGSSWHKKVSYLLEHAENSTCTRHVLAQLQELQGQGDQHERARVCISCYDFCVLQWQALAFWKMARRSRALEMKIYKLANMPCNNAPMDNPFTLDNQNSKEEGTARERSIGLNNRVIGGMLVHTWRTKDTLCPPTRYWL
jgi:hypothetical protein